jgi:hypothetical protein
MVRSYVWNIPSNTFGTVKEEMTHLACIEFLRVMCYCPALFLYKAKLYLQSP